jgi:hypothetical protein
MRLKDGFASSMLLTAGFDAHHMHMARSFGEWRPRDLASSRLGFHTWALLFNN